MIVYLGEQFQPLESIKQTLANQNLTINFFGDRSTPYCKTFLIFPIRITSKDSHCSYCVAFGGNAVIHHLEYIVYVDVSHATGCTVGVSSYRPFLVGFTGQFVCLG